MTGSNTERHSITLLWKDTSFLDLFQQAFPRHLARYSPEFIGTMDTHTWRLFRYFDAQIIENLTSNHLILPPLFRTYSATNASIS
ncbi:hypothetical protein RSO41_00335 [Halomonas sp. I1]|uniref:hypothetical protein n=1 Tax=Halomonas sp. I1 TaxID=393536 RepID=UPI0028DDA8D6|nr:hypothetical protein [Halomonas sp. I1]MDT8893084.1 hypothetical protein [Halomonas sp. I1]